MSRSGYSDDIDNWELIKWRGAVASAIRGKRGQALLRDMLDVLDSMESKRLIDDDLIREGEVCALGALGLKRGIDMTDMDPYDRKAVAASFDIAPALAAEIMAENDDYGPESPEARYGHVHDWVASNIKSTDNLT